MKRFLCLLLILCIIPACVFAIDIDEFNACSAVLGAKELDIANAESAGKYTRFTQDDCSIIFQEESGKLKNIFVEGKGDEYLAYCCAAIHVFDPKGDTTKNFGQLIIMYLTAHRTTEHQTGQTSNGNYFFIEQTENGFMLMVGEN